ncbi:branched-chain amino acid ABC transporter permease [Azospirillum canadense]|uniref:branched-chain amino acid ABC transporter permease n=1 Tax=Azospirillum canadense TaxID=403962 RepID=UPI0022276257|nr:branched-chain amino acid ABC transporter permease [Azospirillum canadense]MCW2238824.1 branched-chain amino acid transport system permease protein [Azospirillum canadense]
MPVFELLIAGILLGGLYALMACGLNLVFGVMRIINFAHGDLLAVGALTTVSIVTGLHLPFFVAIVVVPLLTAALGLAMQVLVLRRLADGPMIMSLLATFALSTILVNLSILIWGGGYRGLPGVLGGSVHLLGQDVALSRLVAFLVAMAVTLLVWWFLQSTRFGRAIRSVSQAPELAVINGISIDAVRNVTFALGAAMAGLAGVLLAPTFASDPQLGARFGIKAFAVIIVGGMGSYPGAMAAALLLGVLEVFGGYWFGQVIGSAMLFLVMLVVLLVRPRGLLGMGVRA